MTCRIPAQILSVDSMNEQSARIVWRGCDHFMKYYTTLSINITVKSPETLLRIPLLHCPKDTDCDTAKGLGPCRMQSIRFRATLQHLPNNKFHYICSASLCGSTLYRVRHILCVSYFWANAFVPAQTRVSHIYKALPRSSRARSTTSLDHKSLSKFALYSTHNSIQSNPKSIQFTKNYQTTSTKQQQ